MPHLLGPAGAPPPPSRNEVLLREAVDRLRVQLDAARQVIEACHAAERYDYDEAGIFRINGALDAYDKLTKELNLQ
jgi:hypothetical protein